MNKNKFFKITFIFLIILSLTITFVVSASADMEVQEGRNVNFYFSKNNGSPELVSSFPLQYFVFDSGIGVTQQYNFLSIFEPVGDYPSEYVNNAVIVGLSAYSDVPYINGDSFTVMGYSIQDLDTVTYLGNVIEFKTNVFSEGILGSISFVPSDSGDVDLYFNFIVTNDNLGDSVGAGLTSSIGWVGLLSSSLTNPNGSLYPMLSVFSVTIAVSAVLLGIYSIKRVIWGK